MNRKTRRMAKTALGRSLATVPEYIYLLEMSLQNVKRDGT